MVRLLVRMKIENGFVMNILEKYYICQVHESRIHSQSSEVQSDIPF